jgi:Protein of unknown function (DUF3574)
MAMNQSAGMQRKSGFARVFICLFGLAPLFAGCAWQPRKEHSLACRARETRWVRETLYFGAVRAHGGEVDVAQWTGFERNVLLAHFPQGYTVLTGNGHWRDDNGVASDEAVRVVVIDHAADAAGAAAVASVIADYRTNFDQEAVLGERSAVCVSFNGGG